MIWPRLATERFEGLTAETLTTPLAHRSQDLGGTTGAQQSLFRRECRAVRVQAKGGRGVCQGSE